MDDFDAKESADHCLNPVARFSDLSPGERFRFPGQKVILLRTKTGYKYLDNRAKRTFRTGAKTAVIPVQFEGQT
jgi:hypothetical protein